MSNKKFGKRRDKSHNKPSKPTIDSNDSVIETNVGLNFKINLKYHLSEKQIDFTTLSKDDNTNIVICDGPAGTSKTFLSVLVALEMLKAKKIHEIIYVRSIVESASKKLGSLPGEVDDKFKPWIMPLVEKCDELIGTHTVNQLIDSELIRCIPVNFLRGSTFKDCVVIVDEAQNLEMNEIVTILTRFGKNCKMFIIGDTLQSDIHKECFRRIHDTFSDAVSQSNGIRSFSFTEEDIMRSKLLKFIVSKVKNLK